jgi:hypothetical protein
VLFAVGVGLLAASTAYGAYDRYFNQEQSGWQALLGGAADATGISAVYAGITGRDLATQHHLRLTPAQQRQMLTEGSIQIGALVLPGILKAGGRLFAQGRAPVAPVRVNCFPSDTLVGSETGLRPIGEVEAGERVWAYDFEGGIWRLCVVECRHDADYDGLIVTLDVGVGEVRATAYHPFWVVEGQDLESRPALRHVDVSEDRGESLPGRWVNSHDLREGDVVFLRDRGPVTIRRVMQRLEQTPVCNLTIEGLHTFAVGEMQVLVHNTSGTGGPVWNAGARRWIDPATGRFVSGPRPPTLPATAAESPGVGWEWRGAPGEPVGGARGAWFRPGTGETLHPDLGHPAPVGPHWDWRAPDGTFWRMFPDGTIVPRP